MGLYRRHSNTKVCLVFNSIVRAKVTINTYQKYYSIVVHQESTLTLNLNVGSHYFKVMTGIALHYNLDSF